MEGKIYSGGKSTDRDFYKKRKKKHIYFLYIISFYICWQKLSAIFLLRKNLCEFITHMLEFKILISTQKPILNAGYKDKIIRLTFGMRYGKFK